MATVDWPPLRPYVVVPAKSCEDQLDHVRNAEVWDTTQEHVQLILLFVSTYY
jgi:hypothetical protein